MQSDSTRTSNRNLIEVKVTIERAVSEVFSFYRDFTNLPRFSEMSWLLSRPGR